VKKILFQLFLTLFVPFSIWAQSEFTLNNMEHVFQSTYLNPSASPDHKFSLGLPALSSIYLGFANTGFSPGDIISTPGGNLPKVWNINQLANKITDNSNFMYFGQSTDLFHLRFKARKTFISFNVTNKNNFHFDYPKDLSRLITLNTIDQSKNGSDIDLTNMSLNQMSYNEYVLGFGTQQKKFVLGVRFKFLQGLNNFLLNADNLQLGVNRDLYDLTFKGSGTLYTSQPFLDSSFKSKSASINDYALNFKNLGFGGDVGFTYFVRKNLTFSVAANNIGFITWKTNAFTYNLSAANVSFAGADILPAIVTSGGSITGLSFTDSLTGNLRPKASEIGAYTTWLIPNMYITGKWNATPRLSVSMALMLEYYKIVRPGFGLGLQYKLGKIVSATGTMSIQYNAMNFGAGIVFKPGPFQFYMIADNILGIEAGIRNVLAATGGNDTYYAPYNSRTFNVRLGMNLVFGKEHLNQKQAFDKGF
jgi:hypothetical protein